VSCRSWKSSWSCRQTMFYGQICQAPAMLTERFSLSSPNEERAGVRSLDFPTNRKRTATVDRMCADNGECRRTEIHSAGFEEGQIERERERTPHPDPLPAWAGRGKRNAAITVRSARAGRGLVRRRACARLSKTSANKPCSGWRARACLIRPTWCGRFPCRPRPRCHPPG
jgi:hypothetical protein